MKLQQIAEGHWVLAPNCYPNSLVKSVEKDKTKQKSERHSPLLHQDDRERFIKWGYCKN
jgi:hypothetical protein